MTRLAALACTVLLACGPSRPAAQAPTVAATPVAAENRAAPAEAAAPEVAPKGRVIPSTPAAAPADLAIEAAIGDPRGFMVDVASYADAVTPGGGLAMNETALRSVLGSLAGTVALDGVDLGQPIFVLMRGTMGFSDATCVVAKVSDQAALEKSLGRAELELHDGWAAIGPGAALDDLAPYALSSVVKTAPARSLTARIRTKTLVDLMGDLVVAALAASGNTAGQTLVDGLRQVDELQLALEIDNTTATLTTQLAPTAGSNLATFATSQRPASYAVAARLGAGDFAVLVAAEIEWGQLATALGEMAATMTGDPAMKEWATLFGHELAFGLQTAAAGGAPHHVGLFGVTDGKRTAEVIATYAAGLAKAPRVEQGVSLGAKPTPTKIGGAPFYRMTVAAAADAKPEVKAMLEKMYGPGEGQGVIGVVGSWMVSAYGKDADAQAKRLVAAAKLAKPTASLGKALDAALADSRSRKESALVAFDLAAFRGGKPSTASRITVGFGFDAGVPRIRINVPVDQIKATLQGSP